MFPCTSRGTRRGRGRRGVGRSAGFLLAALALLPGVLAAQVPPDTAARQPPDSVSYLLEGLIVEASRPVTTAAGASAVELQLDSLEAGPSPMLGEVLRRMPLLRVRRNSRGEDQPSLRGVEERQLAVLVDGIPVTLGWDNRTDLSLIPLAAARDVTVIRGLSSVLAGPNVLGGVIMVGITGGPFPETLSRPFRVETGLEQTGAFSLAGEANGLWHGGVGGLLLRAGGGYRDSPGLARPDGVAQPAGGHRLLLNTDVAHRNAFLAGRYRGHGGRWLSVSSLAFEAEKGVLPELHVREPRLWRIPSVWRSVTALSGGTGWQRTPWGAGDLEAMVGLDAGHERIDAYDSFAYRQTVSTQTEDSRTLTLRLLGEHALGAGIVRSAFTLADTRHEQREPGNEGVFGQRLWSLGAETEQRLARGGVAGGLLADPLLSAGVSVDGAATRRAGGRPARAPLDAWGARLAGSVLVAGGAARVHGGVSRKVRFPSLRELYSGALGRFEPNPELGTEVLVVGEISVTGSSGGAEGQLTLFRQRLEGAIVRTITPAGQFRRENRDEIRSTGLELMANWRLGRISVAGDLTLQDVELLDPAAPQGERRAEYQPEITGALRLHAPLPLDLRGWTALSHVGRQYCVHPDLSAMVAVDPSVALDVGAARRVRLRGAGLPPLSVSVSLSNLTDAVVYEQCGLPREGRTLRVQVELF